MKGLEENRQDEKEMLEHSKLAQDSSKRVHSNEVGLFLITLAQASNNFPRRGVT